MKDLEPIANAITKGLAYAENGGTLDLNNLKAGKSGEMKSIFQYTPDTWKRDAGDVLGNPNAELTPDNETYVKHQIVLKELQKGRTASQIASMHNAGKGEPDAYTGKFSNGQSSIGTNKYGVKFNVPDYAKKVVDYSKKFYAENGSIRGGSTGSVPKQKHLSVSQSGSNQGQLQGLKQHKPTLVSSQEPLLNRKITKKV